MKKILHQNLQEVQEVGGKLASARNFWDFKQLKVPQNPLEADKCIF